MIVGFLPEPDIMTCLLNLEAVMYTFFSNVNSSELLWAAFFFFHLFYLISFFSLLVILQCHARSQEDSALLFFFLKEIHIFGSVLLGDI